MSNKKNNPEVKTEMVKTVSGLVVSKDKTRSIGGRRYLIGNHQIANSGECYMINGKYYVATSDKIIWHQRLIEYVDVREVSLLGNEIVGVLNQQRAVYIKDFNIANFINENNEFEHVTREYGDENYLYNKYYDCYYINKLQEKYISNSPNMRNVIYNHFDLRLYSLSDYETNPHDVINYPKKDIPPSPLALAMEALLNNNSFGIEVETQSGKIPEITLLQNRVTPVKDGSIGGLEYVSLPNYNASDIQKTIEFIDYANKLCIVNDQCSLHVHVLAPQHSYADNNFKLFTISLWMLYYQIQRELTESIPHYKKTHSYIANKGGKDHCQDLPSLSMFQNKIYNKDGSLNSKELDNTFDKLFTFINGRPASKNYSIHTRKSNYGGGRKWDILSRYFALNLYPLFFNEAPTVEYRIHSGTVNPVKIMCWINIVNAITRFAESNTKLIINREQKIDLELILSAMRTNFNSHGEEVRDFVILSDYLIEYMKSRREYFTSCRLVNDNYGHEFQQDGNYDFKHNGRNIFELFD